MKSFIVSAMISVCCFSLTTFAQEQRQTLLSFYPIADSISEFPLLEQELETICQKKVERWYVTFIGRKGEKKIFIGAVTLQPIKDVSREISLTVNFDGAKPTSGKVTTWGYVFDRNNDGKIDYMALMSGAAAVEGPDFPEDFPVRDQHLDMKQLEVFVAHCKLLFNHFADDNFDGTLDAMAHIDMDPVRDWVKRKLVVRSTKFDGTFDDVWAFQQKIEDESERDPVEHTGTKVHYHPLGKLSGELTSQTLQEKTNILQLMNRAAKLCDVTKNFNNE